MAVTAGDNDVILSSVVDDGMPNIDKYVLNGVVQLGVTIIPSRAAASTTWRSVGSALDRRTFPFESAAKSQAKT
jgi:hypothetical protein